ncbi:MAG: gluconokinase [Deltaproteobacteria bacterium]|nr:gluconokinase [Deltaproteobacteria bacterium]
MKQIIEDLKNPDALPEKTAKVNVVQTHISVVFVADSFIYKIKKPVDFGFLDFSTLEKRKHYCHQEVVLNRRLARDLYLDVLPVTLVKGKYTLTGQDGEPVEYAVKMKRIPDDRLMKSLFKTGQITSEHLAEIAKVLSEFHSSAGTSPEIAQYAEPEKFKINTDENFQQVQGHCGLTLSKQQFRDIQAYTNDFYKTHRDLFFKRIEGGRIRDCHGDLHMEHVCLMTGLPIIDCIEFNERFRYSDAIADIAFLLMDLEFHGGINDARVLWNHYKILSKEEDVDHLLKFYKVYRAFVRGKVNGFQIDDPAIGDAEKAEAVQRAQSYFNLAHDYIT